MKINYEIIIFLQYGSTFEEIGAVCVPVRMAEAIVVDLLIVS